MQTKTIKIDKNSSKTYLVSALVVIVKMRVKKFKSSAATTTKDTYAALVVTVGKTEG